jgi:hypothetical protein
VFVLEALSLLEDSVGHSFHTQHERLLLTPNSRAVTALMPIRKAIPPAATPLIKMDLRRDHGRERNQESGALSPPPMFRQESRVWKPPGILATLVGARAR